MKMANMSLVLLLLLAAMIFVACEITTVKTDEAVGDVITATRIKTGELLEKVGLKK